MPRPVLSKLTSACAACWSTSVGRAAGPAPKLQHWELAIASLCISQRCLGVIQELLVPNMTLPVTSSTGVSYQGKKITPNITYYVISSLAGIFFYNDR